MDKDIENVRIFFVDNYVYADHAYKYMPKFKDSIGTYTKNEIENINLPAPINSLLDGITLPI